MEGIKKFKVDTEKLSQKEKVLFDKLIQAAELIAPLYLQQKNTKYPGANFYPHDASKEEIEKAAEKNSIILDPYTFVERNKSGELVAIPFHVKFAKELQPISKLLEEAAKLSENKNFSIYLKKRARSLLDGSYEESEIFWLTTEVFKFGFVIGPIERYLDKLFFRKCAYQAWVGILDKERTEEAEYFKNAILTSQRKILPGSKKVDVSKLGIRVDQAAIFSGQKADFMPTGSNLPNNVNLMEKYGSNITIFKPSLDLKFNNDQFPIFETVFAEELQKTYSREELFEASLRCIVLHEISHSIIRYRDAEERLKDLFPIFDELFAYILGIKGCGSLILKGGLTPKELKAILIMHICRNFTWWLDSINNPDVYHYAKGAAIATNFFVQEKAIKIDRRIFLPEFANLCICIDNLCHFLEYHLALGSYEEAKNFINQYGSFDVLKSFLPQLKKILKKKEAN